MVHLRIVAPHDRARAAIELLDDMPAVCNVVHLEGVARNGPTATSILCDVAREEASIVLDDLRELGIDEDGRSRWRRSTRRSPAPRSAPRRRARRSGDAVIWEEVEERTSENVELSGVFLAFMVLAALHRRVGHLPRLADPHRRRDGRRPGVRPDRGLCVALVAAPPPLACARRSALVVGFPLAIARRRRRA